MADGASFVQFTGEVNILDRHVRGQDKFASIPDIDQRRIVANPEFHPSRRPCSPVVAPLAGDRQGLKPMHQFVLRFEHDCFALCPPQLRRELSLRASQGRLIGRQARRIDLSPIRLITRFLPPIPDKSRLYKGKAGPTGAKLALDTSVIFS